MKHKITDIFFDLDHTLWDFEKNSALAFEEVFRKHQVTIDLPDFLTYYVPINMKYWEKYRKEEITQLELRYGRLKETFDLLNYPIEDSLIHLFSSEYIYYLPQFNHLFEGAIPVLEYLQSKYNLHIITNGFQEIQYNKLKNAKIEGYFKTVTNSEMAGVKKPNPKIFEYALALAKTRSENALMIGDCLEADIQGALNVGISAIFFNAENKEVPETIYQINHLLELKNML